MCNKILGDQLPVETVLKLDAIIFNYIKRNNKKVGLVLGCKFVGTDQVFTGWSLCNNVDKFDKDLAFEIALYRAYSNYVAGDSYDNHLLDMETSTQEVLRIEDFKHPETIIPSFMDIPPSIHKDVLKFLTRLKKYYYEETLDVKFIFEIY